MDNLSYEVDHLNQRIAELDDIENTNEELESEIDSLNDRIAELEDMVNE